MKRRFYSLMLVTAMALSMMACSAQKSGESDNGDVVTKSEESLTLEQETTDPQEEEPKWDIKKSVTTTNTGEITTYEYNENGNCIHTKVENEDGVTYETFSSFDSLGNDIYDKSYEFGELVSTFESYYDEEGRLTGYKYAYTDGTVYEYENEYDKDGNKIHSKNYTNGVLTGEDKSTYGAKTVDDEGNEWYPLSSYESVSFDESSNITYREYSEYDEYLNTTKRETSYDGVETEITDYEYTYDENGNYIKRVTVVNGELSDTEICEYKYDAKGNVLYMHNTGNNSEYESTYEYDAKDRTIFSLTREKNAESGNEWQVSWCERTIYDGEKLVETINYSDEGVSPYRAERYTYNADGSYAFETIYIEADGSETVSMRIEYNSNADAVRGEEFDGSVYEYFYDERGNRIKSVLNGEVESETVYEYFD